MSIRRVDRPKPWQARVRGTDGRERTRAFRRKVDAVRWERSQMVDQTRGEWVDPRSGQVRLDLWLRRVQKLKPDLAESTKRRNEMLIRRHIVPHFAGDQLADVNAERVQRWVSDLTDELSPSTVRTTHSILAESFRAAVRYGRLGSDPTSGTDLPALGPAEHRYLSRDESDHLASGLPDWAQPVVAIGALAGLRPGEIFGLTWAEVDLEEGSLRVVQSMRRDRTAGPPKTRRSRRAVSMGADLTRLLREHRRRLPSVGYVVHRQGEPVGPQGMRKTWARAVRETVGEPMVLHDLRHTHVALLIAAGAHPRAIADRLGHSSITTTMDTYGGLYEATRKGLGGLVDSESRGSDAAQNR